MKSLDKLPSGRRVFIDANVLVYFFLQIEPFAETCTRFFERVSQADIEAFTSADVATNVIHRAMVAEAIVDLGIEPQNAVNHLKSHPDDVKQLNRYKTIPSDIARARIRVLDLTYQELHSSKKFRADYGLMTGDSTIVAVMRRYKLNDLVTNDPDFRAIPNIRVWVPK